MTILSSLKKEINMILKCPLCSGRSQLFTNYRKRDYYRCDKCKSLFVDPKALLNQADERARYLEHNNDVFDKGYRSFVSPIINAVTNGFNPQHQGLDFGSGTGPVISEVLKEKGYSIVQYDPFFLNKPELLKRNYDYIVCSEVIEHFYNPRKEFGLLYEMLNPGGELICMTHIFSEEIIFEKWYYKDDATHVFFYHHMAFEFIKSEFNFSELIVENRLVRFIK